jgi:hypothetical protein
MTLNVSSTAFDAVVAKLPSMLSALLAQPLLTRLSLGEVPAEGVYVFYEPDATGHPHPQPLYVGRSGTLRNRIMQHGRPGADHNTASFAFLLAAHAMGEAYKAEIRTRKQWQRATEAGGFGELYLAAKERVANMHVRFLEVSNDIHQVLFEVYIALALNTPFNDFKTS